MGVGVGVGVGVSMQRELLEHAHVASQGGEVHGGAATVHGAPG